MVKSENSVQPVLQQAISEASVYHDQQEWHSWALSLGTTLSTWLIKPPIDLNCLSSYTLYLFILCIC